MLFLCFFGSAAMQRVSGLDRCWEMDIFKRVVIRNKQGGLVPMLDFTKYTTLTANLSDDLNNAWDPAWNVVIVYATDLGNYDSVLYGYGFNRYRFWSNGHKVSNDGYISFIIWKDYNCLK